MEFLKKMSSGRFYATVVLVTTYCICMVGFGVMAIIKVISPDVFIGLFAGFSALVGAVVTYYFNKKQGGEDVNG